MQNIQQVEHTIHNHRKRMSYPTCMTSSMPRSRHPPALGSYNWVPYGDNITVITNKESKQREQMRKVLSHSLSISINVEPQSKRQNVNINI